MYKPPGSNDDIFDCAKEIPLDLSIRPPGFHDLEDLEVVVGVGILVFAGDRDTTRVRDVFVRRTSDFSENWAHNSACYGDAKDDLLGKDRIRRYPGGIGRQGSSNLNADGRGVGDMASTVPKVEAADRIMGSSDCSDLVAVLGVVDVRLATKA